MKKIFLFFIVFCLTCFYVLAQGALQFNQVKLITNSQQTVPAGKVWKLVGVAGQRVLLHDISTGTATAINPQRTLIIINGTSVDVGVSNPSTGTGSGTGNTTPARSWSTLYVNTPTTFPLWLPENTTLEASTNVSFISVIEFNIN